MLKDFVMTSHDVTNGLAVGGTFTYPTNITVAIGPGNAYINQCGNGNPTCSSPDVRRFLTNGKLSTGPSAFAMSGVKWDYLEKIALKAVNSTDGDNAVVVVDQGTQGGVYSFCDFVVGRGVPAFRPESGTVAIFRGTGTIRIRFDKSCGDAKFYGTILAPFATVTVDDDIGFVNGQIFAKFLRGTNAKSDYSNQYHGHCQVIEPMCIPDDW